ADVSYLRKLYGKTNYAFGSEFISALFESKQRRAFSQQQFPGVFQNCRIGLLRVSGIDPLQKMLQRLVELRPLVKLASKLIDFTLQLERPCAYRFRLGAT